MSIRCALPAACLIVLLCVPTAIAEIIKIGWNDLAPVAETYENPFSALSNEQLGELRTILRYQQSPSQQSDETLAERAATARKQLAKDGLNVEMLFAKRKEIMEKRRTAATATRPEIVGRTIRLPGYLLPLDLKDGKAVEFLLVPTVGACIHTPPPPANQMVHVVFEEGVAINGLFSPVWVVGQLESRLAAHSVRYSDGQAKVEVSYSMRADAVEHY